MATSPAVMKKTALCSLISISVSFGSFSVLITVTVTATAPVIVQSTACDTVVHAHRLIEYLSYTMGVAYDRYMRRMWFI